MRRPWTWTLLTHCPAGRARVGCGTGNKVRGLSWLIEDGEQEAERCAREKAGTSTITDFWIIWGPCAQHIGCRLIYWLVLGLVALFSSSATHIGQIIRRGSWLADWREGRWAAEKWAATCVIESSAGGAARMGVSASCELPMG